MHRALEMHAQVDEVYAHVLHVSSSFASPWCSLMITITLLMQSCTKSCIIVNVHECLMWFWGIDFLRVCFFSRFLAVRSVIVLTARTTFTVSILANLLPRFEASASATEDDNEDKPSYAMFVASASRRVDEARGARCSCDGRLRECSHGQIFRLSECVHQLQILA